MFALDSRFIRYIRVLPMLFAAACGDETGQTDATGEVDADTQAPADTVILPDTVPTEIDTVEDTALEVEVEIEVIVPGEFGAPCNTNADCDSGYCVDGPKGYVCTRTCDTTCPVGYDCKAVSGGSDVVFLCLPRMRQDCQPCATNFQCQGGLCLDLDGQGACAYPCQDDEDCSEGFGCAETDQGEGTFCQPLTGSCSCYAGADGGLRSCTTPSELGVCVGTQECTPETGWSACNAPEAVPEVCNGRDDDCDGVWDDDLEGVGETCLNTVEGVGACEGIQLCLGQAGLLCVGPTPSVEVCNNFDDDCDGEIDEDFRDENGAYATDDNCGGCGVRCEGQIPNATAFCSDEGNFPRCEVLTCEPGFYKAGPLTCLPIVDNSCVPCLDDSHCTTPGDRCLPLDGASFCGRDCAEGNGRGLPAGECPDGYTCEDVSATEGEGVRQCVPVSRSCTCLAGDLGEQRICSSTSPEATCFGTQTCDPALGWSECTAAVAAAETCNGLDDNCNGVVDDLPNRFSACPITNSLGTCTGVLDCAGGAALTCVGQTPSAETCNGLDDDCDGQTDEVTLANCPLQRGVCAGSKQICAGRLGLLACDAGSYGADYELIEASCDGLDNDCDGLTDEVDQDGDGRPPIACGGTDCDDLDRLSFPGAQEICGDARDNDCNGVVDDRDFDGDGFISNACGGPDCFDSSDQVNPSRAEVCGDFLDNDCDGLPDNKDADGDGFIDAACSGGTDCNDARADVRPGAEELCDGIDNNCNGQTDERDADGDGFIAAACGGPDCDDTRPTVNPDRVEICGNTLDEDCSGLIEDLDSDGDGFPAEACGGSDCDDFDPSVRPGALEIWDAKDNNCEGAVDEGLIPVGAVIVSELLPDTSLGGTLEPAEYFELTNVTPYEINLKGWSIWDCGSLSSSCSAPDGSVSDIIQVLTDLPVAPGGTAVFCKNGDPIANGGIECDFEYGSSMDFGNGGDEVILSQGLVNSTGTGSSRIISRTSYSSSSAGRARSLPPQHYLVSLLTNEVFVPNEWCEIALGSPFQIGTSGNYGTPGAINPADCSASPPPGVALVLPPNGLATGGEVITLYGSGLTTDATVTVGGVACTNVSNAPETNGQGIRCTITAGTHTPGLVSVALGSGATLANAYTFTNTGDIGLTSAALVGATAYTIAAGLPGPVITGSAQPGGVVTRYELGYGNGNPETTANWRWFPAVPSSATAYVRNLVIPTAGTFAYGYRFSVDGITWRYTNRSSVLITP